MPRVITTHTDDPDNEVVHVTCLDEGRLYAIEIDQQTGKTFGERLYDAFNAGDLNAFAFSRLNLEKRTRWETAALELLRHTARNPLLQFNTMTEGGFNGITIKALIAVINDLEGKA